MDVQHSIAQSVSLEGPGLFGGQPATVSFHPAPANHGVVFRLHGPKQTTDIPALVKHVVRRERRTVLREGSASIETCEHCLSALAGLAIDNVVVEVQGPELPGLDGSARPYLEALLEAGREATTAPRHRLVIREPVVVREGDMTLAAVPSDEPGMQVIYHLSYPMAPAVRDQVKVFEVRDDALESYAREIAPARTFLLEQEARAMREKGVGAHLTPDDVLVIGPEGPLGTNEFRFLDEPVRHKILDLIGDLYLLGSPIQGRVLAFKSGHAQNHALVRKLQVQVRQQTQQDLAKYHTAFDIRRLARIMPHRYPMLLIDRVIEIDGDRRAVGIKNVTINEPFFQGHYPGTPIMPGVLIVESMAQLSGVLIGQTLEHRGKIPVLLSLDRVKLRKPVTPGDQLILEAESIRVRSRIAHMKCRAFVADELAAEAEVKFMLVDDEQE